MIRSLLPRLLAALSIASTAASWGQARPPEPERSWQRGMQVGYLSALCRLESQGVISPRQTQLRMQELRAMELWFDEAYLVEVLHRFVGLKSCSLSRRARQSGQLLDPPR